MTKFKSYISISVIILTSCILSGAFAGTNAGITALKNHDYKTAYRIFTEESKAGNLRAEARLGYMYFYGLGVHKNNAKAFKLFLDAANKGNGDAQYIVGIAYKLGGFMDVSQNLTAAVPYLKKAADAGIRGAQYQYSEILYKGLGGVTTDRKAAYKLLAASAKQNYYAAQWSLSLFYIKGVKVPLDEQTAFMYATKSAQQTLVRAEYPLALYYAQGVGTAKDPIKAFTLMRNSAQKGYAPAQYRLGVYYYKGFGTSKNIVAAKSWIQKAAAQGMRPAKNAVTNCFTYDSIPNIFCSLTDDSSFSIIDAY